MRPPCSTVLAAAGLGLVICLSSRIAAASITAPDGGQIHALVVGIDNYAHVQRLKGAVADATDLNEVLLQAGVKDVKTLIDQDATRPAVLAELDRLVDRAQPKDLVILSFAGHGARRPESVPHSKPDGMDEAYILQRFDPQSKAPNPDLIIGPEMKHYLSKLEAKSVDVLFIADTCHGGGMTRQPDSRAGGLSYRTSVIGAAAEAMLDTVSDRADAYRDDSSFKRVTFLAAVDRFSKAPEVDIPGQPTKRGALSYAVARAIEGAVVRNGAVSRGNLFAYTRQVVSQYAKQRQTIVTEPTSATGSLGNAVWRANGAAVDPDPGVIAITAPVRVAVKGDPSALAAIKPASTPFVIVTDAESADVVWDARTREAIVAGDVVAHEIEARDVPAMVERVRALGEIALISERRPQTIELLPNSKLHHAGEPLAFEANNLQRQYAVIFNITGNGVVQFQYPDPARQEPAQVQSPIWRLALVAGKPYGADTVVAIVSDQPLTNLADEIEKLDERSAALRAVQLMRQYLPKTVATRVGFACVFTGP